MLIFPCLCSIASAALLTVPRAVRTAAELGLDREGALMAWQVIHDKLCLCYRGLRQNFN
jgi:hypothetical protein